VVIVEKTLAISFHTIQNKKPVLPHIIFEGRAIPFNAETKFFGIYINPLNAELNPIGHLLALLGAHHILHVSRIRVNEK
jgi:hypothetical protein